VREIRLHDTLSGQPRTLEPRRLGKVGIYVCGPTVYAPVHVGNARPFVVFALLKRFLEHQGNAVTLVENITDVNDKIYDAARAAGLPSMELAGVMGERYIADTDRLELGRPDHEPKASDQLVIDQIIDLIGALLDRGHAYAAAGDVYFRVSSFPGYGKLSNRALDQMRQEAEVDDRQPVVKEGVQDFALWKARKPGEDSAWQAPWGAGRPGWHIECSAMAESALGLDFEIHGGGSDLVFPHHENEIAQTEAGRAAPLARIWMHNGMVRFDDEKMSKSVGNVRLLAGALAEAGRDALVMYFVAGHYRQPIVFSPQALTDAGRAVARVREFCRKVDPAIEDPDASAPFAERFLDALSDDFNTAAARAVLFEWIAEGNRRLDAGERVGVGRLREMLWLIGMERLLETSEDAPGEVAKRLLSEREQARAARDFTTADQRRADLAALGFEVRDTADGPVLVRQ